MSSLVPPIQGRAFSAVHRLVSLVEPPRRGGRCRFSFFLLAGLLFLSPTFCLAQPKSGLKQPPEISPEEGRKMARALVNDLLSLKPQENLTQTMVLNVRDEKDNVTQVPVRLQVITTPTNFLNIYETTGGFKPGMKLTIKHTDGAPNEYWFSRPVDSPPRKLSAGELSVPFGGSDFSAADLGLEFLHWPNQRVVRNLMRRSVYCHLLESANPNPVPGSYSKVLSWIGANRPGELVLVHAEAFDANGRLWKLFDPKKLEKIDGVHQLEEMEIRNRQARTKTVIRFNLEQSQAKSPTGR